MLPIGFRAGSISAGISNKKDKKDLSLFISEVPANAAALFTSNIVKAAPVINDIAVLKKSKKISAIIANSGCANACAGKTGLKNAAKMSGAVEKEFNLTKNSVLCASTGVIGQHINLSGLETALKTLSKTIGNSQECETDSVLGIMTTDTAVKKFSSEIKVKNGKVTLWGCAKGSGMIHPSLKKYHATMLAFILTDAQIESSALQNILENAANISFNCISVDGDTSTNDTLIALANGQSATGKLQGADLKKFIDAFEKISLDLAKSMAKDGEGASKFIEIEVKRAKTKTDAKKIAQTIATSPLFKTAIFGADANWGRVIAAAGRAGVNFDWTKTNISLGGIDVFKKGAPVNFNEEQAKENLLKKEIKVVIDLCSGKEFSKYYTCDFSYDYVKINGDYRS